jgi:endo-1,4-beta-xylanase
MKTLPLINRTTVVLMATAMLAGPAFAQEKKLPEGKSVLTPGMDGHRRNGGPNGEGEFKIVEVAGQPFKQAIRATVKKTPSDVWHTQISTLLAQPLKRGDVVLISFHVRSEKSGGSFNVYFGTPETELEVTFAEELSAGEKWKHVQIPATVAADYEAGKGMLNFDFGLQPQTLEFADIKLVNFGAKAKASELPRSGY